MELTMNTRREIIQKMAPEYQKATKKEKRKICLDRLDSKLKRSKTKRQIGSYKAFEQIRAGLPFPLLGIDSDTGGEFINNQLIRYCQKEQITFTRSRPSKKNDNGYVEQKNGTMVRKRVGYLRYETEDQLLLLNQLYSLLGLDTPFFPPVTKLVFQERVNSKVKRNTMMKSKPH